MSLSIFTRSTLSPFEKFIVATGFMRSQIPPEIEHLVLKACYYENDSYVPNRDTHIEQNDITKNLPVKNLLHGFILDKKIFKKEHDLMFVWCNECHEWHRHFCDMDDPKTFIPQFAEASCTKDFNMLYQSAKLNDPTVADENIDCYINTGYYVWPVAKCILNEENHEVQWSILTNPYTGPLQYEY